MSRDRENQCLEDFINVYRSESCLWKVKSAEYHDRVMKERAYKRLVQVWKEVDGSCDKITILKKINNLRSSYRKELKKVRESQETVSSLDDVYKPKLWYYHLLTFLNDQERNPQKSNKNIYSDNKSSENDEELAETPSRHFKSESSNVAEAYDMHMDESSTFSEVSAFSAAYENPQKHPRRSLPSDTNKRTEEVLMNVKEYFKPAKTTDDRYDIFGKMVAMKLRDLRSDQKRWAEKFIFDILFEAEGGSLDGNFAFVRRMPSTSQYNSFPDTQYRPSHEYLADNYASTHSTSRSRSPSPRLNPPLTTTPTPGSLSQHNFKTEP